MGLDKNKLSINIKSVVDKSSREAFEFAMKTPYTIGKPEHHITRMSVRFGTKFSELIHDSMSTIIDEYIRAAFAIRENSNKPYNDENNPIRNNGIFKNAAGGFASQNSGDDRPSIKLSEEIMKYIKKDTP